MLLHWSDPATNFWWLSWFPPPPSPAPMSSFSKHIWVIPLWILPKFSAIPPFGFSVTTDPQGINNDRSLMCFAVIMQHANMAYHVQRPYKGQTIWPLRGGRVVEVIWEKNILKFNFERRKVLNILWLPEVWGKKFLTQTHEITQITCRKSCYCLTLRLRHQSLIVHSRSKLVDVYSLLHDECNTSGRLGTF